jgi:hypothetical protein
MRRDVRLFRHRLVSKVSIELYRILLIEIASSKVSNGIRRARARQLTRSRHVAGPFGGGVVKKTCICVGKGVAQLLVSVASYFSKHFFFKRSFCVYSTSRLIASRRSLQIIV